MEDSSLDWENFDYTPEYFEDAGDIEKSSGVGWILNRGLSLGKKLVITGVVVSSAPVVVPPLLVVSALGLAFSVPFGFMYASYACTQKLMSKLLPQAVMPNEVVEEEDQLDDDAITGFSEDMRNHQEELAYDNHKVVSVVREPDEELSAELRKDGELKEDTINREDANGVAAGDVIMTGDDAATPGVGDKDDMKAEGNANTEMIIGGILVEGSPSGYYGTRVADTILPVQTHDLKAELNDDSSKKEILLIELEDRTDAKFGVAVGDMIMITSENTVAPGLGDKDDTKSEGNANTEMIMEAIKVEGSPSGDFGTRSADTILPVQTFDFKRKLDHDSSKKEIVQIESEDKTGTKLGGVEKDVCGLKEADKGNKLHTNAKGKKKTPKTQKRVQGDVSKAQDKDKMKHENVSSENNFNMGVGGMELSPQVVAQVKIKETVVDRPVEKQQAGHSQADGSQSLSQGNSKNVIEAGDLSAPFEEVQENNKNIELLASDTANKEPQGRNLKVSVSEPVLKQHEDLYDLKDIDGVREADNGLHGDKEVLRDEEIWKQIDSIRVIVGFKLPRHTSYLEELKALYLFTGIEPPSLFKDPFDAVEVCDKLRLLMSVIGVK